MSKLTICTKIQPVCPSIKDRQPDFVRKSKDCLCNIQICSFRVKKIHGDLIFGGSQPKRALDAVKNRLADDGFFLKTCPVKKSGKMANGFLIQRIGSAEPVQTEIEGGL